MARVLLRPGPRGSASRLLLAPQGAEREAPLLHRAEEVAVPGWHAARSSRGRAKRLAGVTGPGCS